MFELSAPLVDRREVGREMWVLAFVAPPIAEQVRAGQFVNLGLPGAAFLRRPFSVYRADEDRIEIVLKAVGAGTQTLLEMRMGDKVSCLGPLGHGFELGGRARTVALVSGGLGVAPMPLAARDARAAGMRVIWVHGARDSAELCTEEDGDQTVWATDNGTFGFHGTAVDASPDADLILACGPNRMLAAVAARWPDAQVAVETYMGCGTGVCLGCAVPLKAGGYDRACKEGPVYRAGDVDWSALPSNLPYALRNPNPHLAEGPPRLPSAGPPPPAHRGLASTPTRAPSSQVVKNR